MASLQLRLCDMSSSFEQIGIADWESTDLSLLETLDHVLNRGLVIAGEITISVADIDLIYLGLNVLLSSVETAHEVLRKRTQDLATNDVHHPDSSVSPAAKVAK